VTLRSQENSAPEIDGCTPEGCEQLVNDARFSHTRIGYGCWRDVVWIYFHDSKSPSGVTRAGSTTEPVLESVRRPRYACPLSPVEPR
jgi:hypothetical protein